jgi:tagatose 6-phosphate kinase
VILCVCPSPAIDVTYEVAGLRVGDSNRVLRVTHRPGGKAVNVARVLTTIGEHATVLAPFGGDTGTQLHTGLAALGVTVQAVPSGLPTRRTVTVVDSVHGHATVLSEASRVDCWSAVADRFAALLPEADAVVISGSLPHGAPPDALAVLAGAARREGRPVVVDTSGAALAGALAGRPTVVKPNAAELAELAGHTDTVTAARALVAQHGVAVVASLGADGLIAVDTGGTWLARPARPLRGNPTGAGDALVAGLARGLARGEVLPDLLGDCVALSAAAVLAPHAGEVDPAEVRRQRAGVLVRRWEAVR